MWLDQVNSFVAKHTKILAGIVIFMIIGLFMSFYTTDLSIVNEVQYRSLRYSVLAADVYNNTGTFLATPTKDSQEYGRFEEVTKDDAGYPMILSLVTGLGLIHLDPETIEELQPLNANLEQSREIMVNQLASQIAGLSPHFFLIMVALLSFSLLFGDSKISALQILGISFTLCVIIIFAPSLFLERLHSHGLISSCVVLACFSASLLIVSKQTTNKSFFLILLFAAGITLGIVDIIRHSQGIAALGALSVFSLIIGRGIIMKTVMIASLILGLFTMHLVMDEIREQRDLKLEIPASGTTSIVKHPYYHTLLTGISAYPDNSLGIKNESDAIDLVRTNTGKPDLQQDSPEYLEHARRIFLGYVLSHPMEFIKIIQSKASWILKRLEYLTGLKEQYLPWVLCAMIVGVGIGFFQGRDNIFWISLFSMLLMGVEMYIPLLTSATFSNGVATSFLILCTFQIWYWLRSGVQFIRRSSRVPLLSET